MRRAMAGARSMAFRTACSRRGWCAVALHDAGRPVRRPRYFISSRALTAPGLGRGRGLLAGCLFLLGIGRDLVEYFREILILPLLLPGGGVPREFAIAFGFQPQQLAIEHGAS